MNIQLNERDIDRLTAIAKRRGMSIEDCAHGLIQQAMRSWEAKRPLHKHDLPY